jgi:hypothetical protein
MTRILAFRVSMIVFFKNLRPLKPSPIYPSSAFESFFAAERQSNREQNYLYTMKVIEKSRSSEKTAKAAF